MREINFNDPQIVDQLIAKIRAGIDIGQYAVDFLVGKIPIGGKPPYDNDIMEYLMSYDQKKLAQNERTIELLIQQIRAGIDIGEYNVQFLQSFVMDGGKPPYDKDIMNYIYSYGKSNSNSKTENNSIYTKNMGLTQKEYFKKFFWMALMATKSVRKALFALSQSYLESGGLTPNKAAIWHSTNNLFGITKNTGGFRSYKTFKESFEDWNQFMHNLYFKYITAKDGNGFAQVAYSPYITDKDGREVYRQNILRFYEGFKKIYYQNLVKWALLIILPIVIGIPLFAYLTKKSK